MLRRYGFGSPRDLASAQLQEAQVPKKSVISIVDDDQWVRESTVDLVTAMGFTAVAFPSAADFLNSSQLGDTCCLIADVQMPGMTGIELHEHLAGSGNMMATILITAYPDDRDCSRALQAGVIRYLSKPFNYHDMLTCVRRAFALYEGRNENAGENHV
jgi:FixJ family two-component response regulator